MGAEHAEFAATKFRFETGSVASVYLVYLEIDHGTGVSGTQNANRSRVFVCQSGCPVVCFFCTQSGHQTLCDWGQGLTTPLLGGFLLWAPQPELLHAVTGLGRMSGPKMHQLEACAFPNKGVVNKSCTCSSLLKQSALICQARDATPYLRPRLQIAGSSPMLGYTTAFTSLFSEACLFWTQRSFSDTR